MPTSGALSRASRHDEPSFDFQPRRDVMMRRPVVFMFSGQGSQYYQMGKEIFDQQPVFRKWMSHLDTAASELINKSVLNELYDERKRKSDTFDRLLYSHPAIFMVEYALARVLVEGGIEPDYVLGTSMGEFASAAVADVMSPVELLELLIRQAEICETHCQEGGMLAILHEPRLYHETPLIAENTALAATNFDDHFVVSGNTEILKHVEAFLKREAVSYQRLPVSQGFHSSLIEPGASIYAQFLKQKSYQPPQIPFVSCSFADVMRTLPHDHFWQVVRKPILFQETIQELEKRRDYIYLDVGPSGTLATFVKYNLTKESQSESFAILTPFGQDLGNLQRVEMLFSGKRLSKPRQEVKRMTTFVFPGQGSQFKGMGGELFDEYGDLTSKADAILGYSVKKLCLEDPNRRLSQTNYTQPALYVVNALSYLKRLEQESIKPDFVAGHSLGEYNALLAAGVLDFETGLRLVSKRGELLGHKSAGGMAAVIGLSGERVREILKENGLKGIDIANYNTPTQIVISGPAADIQRTQPIFEAANAISYIPLNVSGPFHSRYMEEARKGFLSFLKEFEFSEPRIPVISNVEARPYKKEDIKRLLSDQITHPVKWEESIRYLMGQGEMAFEEIGPGTVLTDIIVQIRRLAKPLVLKETEDDLVRRVTRSGAEEKGPRITALSLGSEAYRKTYNVKYAYASGGMYKGIASKELVVRMGKAGLMSYFGTGGLQMHQIEEAIQYIQAELNDGQPYGMNLFISPMAPQMEEETVEIFLKYGVKNIETAGYMQMSPALVRYRLRGLSTDSDGGISICHRIQAKLSRPEIAELFLSPAPERIAKKLVEENMVTQEQADLSKNVPMADDLCVEADSGGHTDQGLAYALMPAMIKLRDRMMEKHRYGNQVRIGAAGGIGTPEAAAAAFVLGADFILTGSINQCTVEAATSEAVKDLLQVMNVQDTDYAPAADMFEMGAKVQVLRKGLFFPARANKLYHLYQHYNSLDEIDEKTKKQLQEKYFRRSFEEIYEDVKAFHPSEEIEKAERNPKHKMALVFRWYFGHSTQLALSGNQEQKVDYQVHCGPALGAFNQWVKGTKLENWRNRHVDEIAEKLMQETAELLRQRFRSMSGGDA